MMPDYVQIERAIERTGLTARGAFRLDGDERPSGLDSVSVIVMIGVVGAKGWPAFAQSPEQSDGRAQPLDRWSRRIIGALAAACGARALFPFQGPPYWPFQRWARRAEPLHSSPLGMLIHPDYGLWHSYRGALGFAELSSPPVAAPRASPCETCRERPCLSACPVGAFTGEGYDVATCARHLSRDEGRACMDGGCLARRACPIGPGYAHGSAQARFHMQAFLRARQSAAGEAEPAPGD
jgi:hypothetical protein